MADPLPRISPLPRIPIFEHRDIPKGIRKPNLNITRRLAQLFYQAAESRNVYVGKTLFYLGITQFSRLAKVAKIIDKFANFEKALVLLGLEDEVFDPRELQEAAVRRFLETMPIPEPTFHSNAREFNLALQHYSRTTKRSLRSILLGAGVGVASKVGARGKRSQSKRKPHGSGILGKSLQPTSRLLERNTREWLMTEVESTSKRWQKYHGKTITRIQIFELARGNSDSAGKIKIFKNKGEARKEARNRAKITQGRRAYYAAGFMQAAEDLSRANRDGKNFKNPYRIKDAGYGVPPKSRNNPELQIVHNAAWATISAVDAVEEAIAMETREKVKRIEKRLAIDWNDVKMRERI